MLASIVPVANAGALRQGQLPNPELIGRDFAGPKAVLNLGAATGSLIQERCQSESDLKACLIAIVSRIPGASEKAAAFTHELYEPGLMIDFREMGVVDLATVLYPLRADGSVQLVLVNPYPNIRPVDHWGLSDELDLSADPLYETLVKEYISLALWFTSNRFAGIEQLAGGGQRFVFNHALTDGCGACGTNAQALIAHDYGTIAPIWPALGPTSVYREPGLSHNPSLLLSYYTRSIK